VVSVTFFRQHHCINQDFVYDCWSVAVGNKTAASLLFCVQPVTHGGGMRAAGGEANFTDALDDIKLISIVAAQPSSCCQ
jgi:hypothetical protein